MTTACPVGHPTGPGQTVCPLCGRTIVMMAPPATLVGEQSVAASAPTAPEARPATVAASPCPFCGVPQAFDAQFCANCGVPTASPPSMPQVGFAPASGKSESSRSSPWLPLAVVGAIAVLIGAAVVGLHQFSGAKPASAGIQHANQTSSLAGSKSTAPASQPANRTSTPQQAASSGVTYKNGSGLSFSIEPENAIKNTESLDGSRVAPVGSHYVLFNLSVTNTSDRRGSFDMNAEQFLFLQDPTAEDVKGCQQYQKEISQGNTITVGQDCNAVKVTRPSALYTNDGVANGQVTLGAGEQADLSLEYLLADDVINAGDLSVGTSNTDVLTIPPPMAPSS
ncbi:MAG: hypothetical protein JWL79_138 [Frankiales bacterium]|nr:hypothetical protein [Frankiales bacterium]